MQPKDQLAWLLQDLAAKLGTTVEYLWSVLIRQAYVSATIELLYILALIITGRILYKLHFKYSKPEGDYGYTKYNKSDGTCAFMVVFAIIWGFVFLMIVLFGIQNMITGYINPEYWALEKVLDTIKN